MMNSAILTRPSELPGLGRSRLCKLPANVHRPSFDPALLRAGIVHLGCGAFHRAHQAVYTQRAIEDESALMRRGSIPPPWGIVSASLRSSGVVDELRRQDGVYSVLERGGDDGPRVEVVASLVEALFLGKRAERLMRRLCDADIRIVTLTVTQAGYCTDPVTGGLDAKHDDIVADLRSAQPTSAIGLLVRALARRRAQGIAPPVILSCDNVADNGRLLRRACIDFAALCDDGLSQWIEDRVQFPGTMVDRIVPVASDDDRRVVARALQMRDAAVVPAEPFLQWVIETFDGPRPRWEAVGARFVDDVAPWNASKLRLLNGGHLALAYLGLLQGLETVSQAMARPHLAAFALRFMLHEQCPTLPASDHDIGAYAHQLLQRWRNPDIVHRLDRITRDSSKKLAPRLLDSLRDNLAAHRPAPCTVMAVAAWMCCVDRDERSAGDPAGCASQRLLGSDTGFDELERPLSLAREDGAGLVGRLLGEGSIFGDDLAARPEVRAQLVEAVDILRNEGVKAATDRCLGEYTC